MRMEMVLEKAKTFVDLGAEYGYYSYLAYSQMQVGKVCAIEAGPMRACVLKNAYQYI